MDLANTRMALDMLAVTAIVEDESGRRMRMLEDSWAEYSRVEMDPNPVIRHESHVAFHRKILAATENAMLLRLWPVTEAHLTIILAQDQATRADPVRAHNVHEKLVNAIRTKDLAVIRDAFTEHTIDSAKEIIALLDNAKNDNPQKKRK